MKCKIIQGDCLGVMQSMEACSVQCCVTSPPYWGLRSSMPGTVMIKDSLSSEEKEKVIKELTLLGVNGIVR